MTQKGRVIIQKPREPAEVKALLKKVEYEARKVTKGKTLNELQAEIMAGRDHLARAKTEREGILAQAKRDADDIRAAAEQSKQALLRKAHADAEEIRDGAHKIAEQAEAGYQEMSAEREVLRLRQESLQQDVDTLNQSLKAFVAEQERVKQKELELDKKQHQMEADLTKIADLRAQTKKELEASGSLIKDIHRRENDIEAKEQAAATRERQAITKETNANQKFRAAQEEHSQARAKNLEAKTLVDSIEIQRKQLGEREQKIRAKEKALKTLEENLELRAAQLRANKLVP